MLAQLWLSESYVSTPTLRFPILFSLVFKKWVLWGLNEIMHLVHLLKVPKTLSNTPIRKVLRTVSHLKPNLHLLWYNTIWSPLIPLNRRIYASLQKNGIIGDFSQSFGMTHFVWSMHKISFINYLKNIFMFNCVCVCVCVAFGFLKSLSMYLRLVLNSDSHLPLFPEKWD